MSKAEQSFYFVINRTRERREKNWTLENGLEYHNFNWTTRCYLLFKLYSIAIFIFSLWFLKQYSKLQTHMQLAKNSSSFNNFPSFSSKFCKNYKNKKSPSLARNVLTRNREMSDTTVVRLDSAAFIFHSSWFFCFRLSTDYYSRCRKLLMSQF